MKRCVVVALVVCVLVACGAEPTPTPDAVATQIAVEEAAHATMTAQAPEATATPTPTDTPEPTDTPIPPTETPEPTATAAGPSLEVQQYAQLLAEETDTLTSSLHKLSELLMDLDVSDQDWLDATVHEMATIKIVHQSILGMDVPANMAAIHVMVLDGTLDCSKSMDKLAEGVDNLDMEALEKAIELMNSCGEKMAQAGAMTDEYMNQFEP